MRKIFNVVVSIVIILAFILLWVYLLFISDLSINGRTAFIMPDDSSISDLIRYSAEHISSVNGTFDGSVKFDDGEVEVKYSGTSTGILNKVSGIEYSKISSDDKIASNKGSAWYDAKNDTFYVSNDDGNLIYSDGHLAVDVASFSSIIVNSEWSYVGRKGMDLMASSNISGQQAGSLLEILHISLEGDADFENLQLTMTVGANMFTGQLSSFSLRLHDSVQDVTSMDHDGVTRIIDSIDFSVDFKGLGSKVKLPDDFMDSGKSASVFAPSFTFGKQTKVGKDLDAIKYETEGAEDTYVFYKTDEVFDTVKVDNGKLFVSSSDTIAGNVNMSMSIISSMDAYTSAKLDMDNCLKYYEKKNDLGEFGLDGVHETSISGHDAYYYMRSYAELEHGYTLVEYCAYIALSDDTSAYVVISSMTDRGSAVVLDEKYALSMFDNVAIADESHLKSVLESEEK